MRKTVTFVWESSRLFNTKGGGGKYVDSVTATTSRKSIRGSGRKEFETQHRDEEQYHGCSMSNCLVSRPKKLMGIELRKMVD